MTGPGPPAAVLQCHVPACRAGPRSETVALSRPQAGDGTGWCEQKWL